MLQHIFAELEKSNAAPSDHINSREFIEGVLKAGSLISMLENKKINTTMLFALLLEKRDYQDFFTSITSSDNFKESILSLLYLHPSLVKSKVTKSLIRKLNAKRSHKPRKVPIQQAFNCFQESKKQTVQNKKRL